MTIESGVSVEQLLHALQRKNIPLPYEIGTFIALECCERILGDSVLVSQGDIFVSDEGDVMLDTSGRTVDEEDACRALVEMLGELLVRSAPGVPTMLLTLVEHGPSDGEWSLKRLRDDLEASLVPLNRAATRRVIARLLREIRRDRGALRGEAPRQREINREIDDVLGGTPELAASTQPGVLAAPGAAGADTADADDTDEDDEDDEETQPRLDLEDDPRPVRAAEVGRAGAEADAGQRARAAQAGPAAPASSAQAPRLDASDQGGEVRDLEQLDESGGSRVGVVVGASLVLLSALMIGAYVALGRDAARQLLGMEPVPPAASSPPPAAEAPPPTPVKAAKPHGDIAVTSTPPHAQVLLYVGVAPVDIGGLPVGVAHELVAMREGHAPARGVVPENATWTESGAELRYELHLQTAPGSDTALGPTQLPREMGAPTGATGTVHVESTPPGARIYQLVGFTPDVHVGNVALDTMSELLVFLKGHALERVNIGADRFQEVDGRKRATIDVTLRPTE